LKINSSAGRDLLFLALPVILFALMRLSSLNAIGLVDPSEGRFALMAQHMLQSGDWRIPKIELDSGALEPYYSKPPLHIWLMALSMKLCGQSDFAARLPGFAASLLTLFLVSFYGWKKFSLEIGYLAALILASSLGFYLLGSGATTDPTFMFCFTLAMVSFGFAAESRRWGLGFFLALALGFLTKGPVIIVLSGLAIVPWLILSGNFTQIKRLPWVSGTLLFCVFALPWFIYTETQVPGFLRYYIVEENILRYVSKDVSVKFGSTKSYFRGAIWLMWLGVYLPWSLILIYNFFKRGFFTYLRSSQEILFAALWGFSGLIFFTFAKNILATYALPSLPGLSILLALLLSQRLRLTEHSFEKLNFTLTGLAFASLAACMLYFEHMAGKLALFLALVAVLILVKRSLLNSRSLGFSCLSFSLLSSALLFSVAHHLDPYVSARPLEAYFVNNKIEKRVAILGKQPQSLKFYSRAEAGSLSFDFISPTQALESQKYQALAVRKKDLDKFLGFIPKELAAQTPLGTWIIFSPR